MIYLLTAVDSTTTLGSKGMTDAIISRMESETQVITFQIAGNTSRLLKWLWEITILSGHPNYTNNPLPMGTTTANISVIWKAAPFRADCTNELHKHTASNRDTVERYSGIKPGVRSLFPSFSHCSFIKQSVTNWPPFLVQLCVGVLLGASNVHQVPPKCQTQDYVLKIQRWTRRFSWTYGGQVYKRAEEFERSSSHSTLPLILLLRLPLGEVPHFQIYSPSLSSSKDFSLGAL